jgi:hypothetical protein
MSFLFDDDCAFGMQSMCGAGQPVALGVGDEKSPRFNVRRSTNASRKGRCL